jgi:hypothetical protein
MSTEELYVTIVGFNCSAVCSDHQDEQRPLFQKEKITITSHLFKEFLSNALSSV